MSTALTSVRRIRFFRLAEDGTRMPHIMELDGQLNFLREYRDVSDMDRVAAGRRDGPPPEVSAERRKGMLVARWTTPAVIENPIPGTDGMRDDYFYALKELQNGFRTRGEICPPCKIGELARSYREKLESGGWLKPV